MSDLLQIDYYPNDDDNMGDSSWRCDAHVVPRPGERVQRYNADGSTHSRWMVTGVTWQQREIGESGGWKRCTGAVVLVDQEE